MTPHGYPNPASVKLMRPDTAGAFSGADDPVSGIAVIPQGRYRVDVKGLPAGFVVASVNYGSQNVSDLGALEVTSTTAASMLDILVDGPGGRLEGVVLDRADAAVSDARVVLAPSADLRQNSSLFLTAFSDQAGRFSIDGIPPGSYGILAWSDVSEGAWLDPEFLAAFETRMERLQIGKGDMESLVLEVIPWIN
jgi:hypothetical protein